MFNSCRLFYFHNKLPAMRWWADDFMQAQRGLSEATIKEVIQKQKVHDAAMIRSVKKKSASFKSSKHLKPNFRLARLVRKLLHELP